jgi:hypothetical protein
VPVSALSSLCLFARSAGLRADRPLARTLLLLAGMALLPLDARAATVSFCVGNSTQLAAVREHMLAQPYDAIDLRLRVGVHTWAPRTSTESMIELSLYTGSPSLTVSGGWNTTCTAQSVGMSGMTTLDGLGNRALMRILLRGFHGSNVPRISVSNLRFFNGIRNAGRAPGLDIYSEVDPGAPLAEVLVEHTAFEWNTGTALSIGGPGDVDVVTVRNSLFADNSAEYIPAMTVGADLRVYVFNNTIRNSTATFPQPSCSGCQAVAISGPGQGLFANNIVHETRRASGQPIADVGGHGGLVVRSNRLLQVTAIGGQAMPLTLNNTTAAPTFMDLDDPRLAASSAMRDLGVTNVPTGVGSVDLDNQQRVRGAAVDLGAFEIQTAPPVPGPIFGNGFES